MDTILFTSCFMIGSALLSLAAGTLFLKYNTKLIRPKKKTTTPPKKASVDNYYGHNFDPLEYVRRRLVTLNYPYEYESWVDEGPDTIMHFNIINLDTGKIEHHAGISLSYSTSYGLGKQLYSTLYSQYSNDDVSDILKDTLIKKTCLINNEARALNQKMVQVNKKVNYKLGK